jgi:hypothetical protein
MFSDKRFFIIVSLVLLGYYAIDALVLLPLAVDQTLPRPESLDWLLSDPFMLLISGLLAAFLGLFFVILSMLVRKAPRRPGE